MSEGTVSQSQFKANGYASLRKHRTCLRALLFEPAHKTNNKTCVTSKDSDQPVHPPSMARVLRHPSLENLEAVEGACDQRKL